MAHINLVWIPELLAKAVIRRSSTMSGSAFTEEASVAFDYSDYVIRVLEAPFSIRTQVKAKAVLLAQTNPSSGLKQLVCILATFEALSPELRSAFILSYRGCATLMTQGGGVIASHQSWDQGHIPPRQEP